MAKSTNLDAIGDKVITMLSRKNDARERGLPLSREAIRHCANAIRAIHRAEFSRAEILLQGAHIRIEEMKQALSQNPELRYGGFVFDAEKEYSEGQATLALVRGDPLPDPDELGVDYAAYVNGLGEAIGEMRRHLLDELRRGDPVRIEDLLSAVDDIYNLLISVDFPDAITSGLRRTTDVARSVLEKTRGDITLAFQQRSLERRLREIESNLQRLSLPGAPPAAEAAPSRSVGSVRRRPVAARPVEAPVAEAPVAVVEAPPIEAGPPPEAAPKRRRRRRRKPALAEMDAVPVAVIAVPAPEAPVPEAPAEAVAAAGIPGGELVPKRRRRRRRRRPAAAPGTAETVALTPAGPPVPLAAASVPEAPTSGPGATPEVEAPPRRRRRRRHRRPAAAPVGAEVMAAAPTPAPAPEAPAPGPLVAPETAAAPKRRRRRHHRRPAGVAASAEAPVELAASPEPGALAGPSVEATPEAPPKPRRPRRRRVTTATAEAVESPLDTDGEMGPGLPLPTWDGD